MTKSIKAHEDKEYEEKIVIKDIFSHIASDLTRQKLVLIGFAPASETVLQVSKNSDKTVSYTHLDVYKRQFYNRLLFCNREV